MASVKRTRRGNWYAVHSVTGKIIKGQPRGGFVTARRAARWAAENVRQVRSALDVDFFDGVS
jgi:hypothetical protein